MRSFITLLPPKRQLLSKHFDTCTTSPHGWFDNARVNVVACNEVKLQQCRQKILKNSIDAIETKIKRLATPEAGRHFFLRLTLRFTKKDQQSIYRFSANTILSS